MEPGQEPSQETEEEPSQEPGGEPPAGGGTDWKAMARKWERLAKSNSDKAKAYDELQEEGKSELQKAQEKARRAEDELAELKARAELDEARRRVAKSAGVPESLVFGATEDEMEANAKAVAEYARPRAGARGHSGRFDPKGGADDGVSAAKARLAREIFGSQA